MRLGVGDAPVGEPGVHLVVGFEPQPGREEPLADQPDLVLDLSLLPTRCRRAGDRLDEVVAAHLQEAAIVEAFLADEDRLHRRLHVVVDAAPAGALEEGEGPVVGVEHHLLRLARIGPHEQHAAVAEPDVRNLHDHRHPAQQDDLVAPVELVGFTLAQRSAEHRPRPSIARVPCSTVWRSAARHRTRRHIRASSAPRTCGSASIARAGAWSGEHRSDPILLISLWAAPCRPLFHQRLFARGTRCRNR